MRTIIGLLDDVGEAEKAILDLKGIGLPAEQISVVSQDAKASKEIREVTLVPFAIGGLGVVAAGGPMAQFLTPQTARANTEAFVSALVKMGVSRAEAGGYVEAVKNGYTLEAAIVDEEKADRAIDIMRRHTHDLMRAAPGPGETKIPVVEEELLVGKREVPVGGVRVSTHVIEEPAIQEILLRSERISVERQPVDQPIQEPSEAFRERTFEVVATAEEPVVAKEARVVEEVVVRKETEAHKETVRGSVRRTDVAVERVPPETDKKNN
jgi:stress response protein YsnF